MHRKIKEKTFKKKFAAYLKRIGAKNIHENQYGVDVVAEINGIK